MSDLTSELRQVADAAGSQARPLPAADVIRRGDRRRRRGIAQRSLGGLSAIGAASLAGVMIFTGAPVASQAASGGASGPPRGLVTVTDSTSSAAGTMTLHVVYQVKAHGMVKVLAVTCSGHSTARFHDPALLFEIDVRPGGKPGVNFFAFVHVTTGKKGDFSGKLPVQHLTVSAKKHHGLFLADDATMQVAFRNHGNPATVKSITTGDPLQLGMIFTAGPAA